MSDALLIHSGLCTGPTGFRIDRQSRLSEFHVCGANSSLSLGFSPPPAIVANLSASEATPISRVAKSPIARKKNVKQRRSSPSSSSYALVAAALRGGGGGSLVGSSDSEGEEDARGRIDDDAGAGQSDAQPSAGVHLSDGLHGRTVDRDPSSGGQWLESSGGVNFDGPPRPAGGDRGSDGQQQAAEFGQREDVGKGGRESDDDAKGEIGGRRKGLPVWPELRRVAAEDEGEEGGDGSGSDPGGGSDGDEGTSRGSIVQAGGRASRPAFVDVEEEEEEEDRQQQQQHGVGNGSWTGGPSSNLSSQPGRVGGDGLVGSGSASRINAIGGGNGGVTSSGGSGGSNSRSSIRGNGGSSDTRYQTFPYPGGSNMSSSGDNVGGIRLQSGRLGSAAVKGSRFETVPGDASWINSIAPDWFPVIPLWQATEKAAVGSEPFLLHLPQGWRVLLLSDGSVTRHLHLFTGRKISVDCLEMRSVGHSLFGVPPGTALVAGPRVQRQVLLKTPDGTPLAYAASWWAEYEAKAHLSDPHRPVWLALQDQRMELLRCLESIYYGHSRELEKLFGQQGPFWARHYLFYHNGRPLTLIYEVFSPVLEEWLGDSTLPDDLYLP